MQKETTTQTPSGKTLTLRLTTEVRDASNSDPIIEIYAVEKKSDTEPGMYIGCYFLSTFIDTLRGGSGLMLDMSRPDYCVENESMRRALEDMGMLPDHADPRVGDVVLIKDPFSAGEGLHGIVMGEEAWLDDNHTQLWDGTGDRPEFVGATSLGEPPRRVLLHVYAAQEFRKWRVDAVLKARSETKSKLYPYHPERNLVVIHTPKIANMEGGDVYVAQMTLPHDVACMGNTEAHARLGIAEALKSHHPYPEVDGE